MKKSFWVPKWWVLLPLALPVVAFLWLQLGSRMGLNVVHAHSGVDASLNASWIISAYFAIQDVIWMLLSPGPWLIHGLHGDLTTTGPFLGAILVSVIFDCSVLYGTLLTSRCANPRYRNES